MAWFTQQPLLIEAPSVSISNIIDTVDASNFACYNLLVNNNSTLTGNVNINGQVNCSQNLIVAQTIFCTTINSANYSANTFIVGSNLYNAGGYYVSGNGKLIIDSNGNLFNAILTGSNTTFNTNIVNNGAYLCYSNGIPNIPIDNFGNLNISNLGTVGTGGGQKLSRSSTQPQQLSARSQQVLEQQPLNRSWQTYFQKLEVFLVMQLQLLKILVKH